MKVRFLLNILISYVLLFPAGVTNIGADTISRPVTVAVPDMNGETDSKPVSVAVPEGMYGSVNTKPVSVAAPEGVYGSMSTKPVSISYAVTAADGSYIGRPATVAFKPENQGDPDLVGLWHMEGDWGDSSGNNNNLTAVNGVSFSPDKKIGTQAAGFNGSNTYLRAAFGNNMPVGNGPRTFMAWIKPYSYPDSTYNGIFAYGQLTCTGKGSLLSIKNDGRLSTAFWCNDAYQTTGPAATLNAWNHVAVTYSGGTTVKFYMNGQFVQESALTAGTTANTQDGPIRIGSTDDPGRVFNGLIDEVAVYKRALTAEEIAFFANAVPGDPAAPPPPTVTLASSIVGTSSVVSSGTKTIGTSIWVNNKKIAPLDNSDAWQGAYGPLQPGYNILNFVAVDAASRQSAPVTKTVIYDNQPPVIESSWPANNFSTAKPVTQITINLTDTYSAIDLQSSIQGATVKNSAQQLISGSWMVSGTKTIIFVPSTSLPMDTYLVTIYPVDAVGNKGQQQIAFTNHDISAPVTMLSVKEAKAIDGWYYSPVTVTLTASDDSEGSGVAKTEYGFDGTLWQLYSSPFILDKDGVDTVYYRSTDKAGNVETTKSSVIKINKTGLVGLWLMDNDNWKDSSVVGNNATVYSNVTFNSNAKIGTYSGSFNGSSSSVSIPDSPTLNAERNLTVMGWIYANVFDKTWQTIFWKGNTPDCTTNCEDREYAVFLNSDGHLQLSSTSVDRVGIGELTASTPAGIIKTAANTPLNNGWYHVAAMISSDQSVMKIYVNGVEQASGAYSLTNIRDTTGPLYIGSNPNWNGTFNGLIDELSIYKRALSATEIQDNYRSYSIPAPTVDPVTSPTTSTLITLSGAKAANTAVVVNGTTVAPLDVSTTWQGTYTLQPGVNNLNVSAMDVDGFHSQAVIVSVTLDVTPPAVVATSPANNAVFNTSVAAITFNLSDAYSAVDLATTITGATVTNASGVVISGAWTTTGTGLTGAVTFTPAFPLAEGKYTATINPTDVLRNTGVYMLSFTIDMTPPPPPTIDPIPSPTNTKAKIVTGTKSLDSVQVVVACAGATAGMVLYPTPLTWSVTVSGLPEGTDTVTAYAVDAATNKSGQVSTTFVIDTIPPAPPIVNPPVTPTKQNTVTLTGTKDPASYLFVNNVQTTVGYADTAWSYTVNLASEGNNAFTLFSRDVAGNSSSSVTVNVVRDTTAPRMLSQTPVINAFVNQLSSIDIALTDDGSSVDFPSSLANGVVKNSSGAAISGAWTSQNGHIIFTPTAGTALADGVYSVTIRPTDVLGNTTTLTYSFTLDTLPPAVQSLTLNPPSPIKAETVAFTVAFNEDMNTSVQPTLSFTRGLFYSTYTIPSGVWTNSRMWQGSYTFTANNGDGTYTVKVAGAQDKAQNTMTTATAGTFSLVTVAPPVPALNPVTTPTSNPNQILSGTKAAGLAIVINGTQRVPVDSSTSWTYSYPLSEGANTLTITSRDAASNDSVPIDPKPVIALDTTPPAFTVSYKTPWGASTQDLYGSKEPNCVVKLNGTQIFSSLDSGQTWTYTVTLTAGITNHLVFTVTDAVGNMTTKTADILFDSVAPPALGPGVLQADGSGKGNEATLSWLAYSETSDLAYYAVYQSLSAFTDVTGMKPVGTTTKGTKTYKATGLTTGTTYYFAVAPVNVVGNQVNSVNAASAAPTVTIAPEDVTNLSASAGYTSAQGNYISLNWTASVNSMGYLSDQILYMDSGTGYDSGTSLGKTITTFTKTGLADATAYKFKLTVKDTFGHESAGVIATGVTRLANPANLTATPGIAQIALSWNAAGPAYVKQYNIYRVTGTAQQTSVGSMALIKSVAASATAYTDTGLVNETTYQYAVTAVNTSGAERTDVLSISGTPHADSAGPVIDSFNITAGQVITAPYTINATAHDAQSAMGSMQLSIDGVVVATQSGGSISYFWNTVAAADGNHAVTLRALDSVGNPTEITQQVIVSLAPPATPVITSPAAGNQQSLAASVSGTAPLFTTVALRVNGIVVGTIQTAPSPQPSPTGGEGVFSFPTVTLVPGDNLLSVKASDRGGDSPYSPDLKITVITGAPPAPLGLTALAEAGGLVRFTWTASSGQVPAGYNLYVSNSSFAAMTDAGVTKTNTTPISYLLKEYLPADDNLKYYAVTAVDSVGNESGLSNVVSIASDRAAPSVASIEYHYYNNSNTETYPATVAGLGSVKVVVTVSEKLQQAPFFSLESSQGSPIVVTMSATDDTHYQGTFAVTGQSPQGPTTYKFSGKDVVGNRGDAQGAGIAIDVQGPVAAIQSPRYTQKILPDPVSVTVALNEPSAGTPSLSLKASDGTSAVVTGLTSTDNITWTGSLNVSSLAEGKAEFIMSSATDTFGNVGTTVTTGRYILLYLNTVPSPGIPDGLAAKSGKAGAVTLTWYPVAYSYSDLGAVTYNLYRRADGDATAVKIQTGIGSSTQNATTTADVPPADGIYYYSVTSVGLMGSESPASAEVQAISDRTGPPAPANLALTLGPGGVTATWDLVTDATTTQPIKGYNLYRAAAAFTSSAGLTLVSKSANALGVDTSPSKTYRFYAVAAVDYLGNEGPLSDCKNIDFPVSPVRNLVLQRTDDTAPALTWQAPTDGGIAGYNIYRNGSLINSYPVPDLSYTDAYGAAGTSYGISAVDTIGNESPVKTVTLPALALGLKDGTNLRRGILETLQVLISNVALPFTGNGPSSGVNPDATATGITIDSIDVRVGTAPLSSIQGPFALPANTTLQLEKVAATASDAQSPVSVFIQANWSPSPGVSVKISRTVATEVLGSSTSFEIFNDPLVRNTDGKVRLKVNNIGTAQMELVTSENNGATRKVKVNLKDQDGNLLSTGYLDQRVGSAIVNGAGYAVARINPNESFTTAPITLPVLASAPNAVVIEAVIDNMYYHYGKADQVTAPGFKGASPTNIQDTPYHATASPEKSFYPNAQPVAITGSAISNDPATNDALVPNVAVKLGVSVRGFDRFYTVTTDATGHYSYTFTPGANEAGDYSIWAVYPDVKDRTVQAVFSIAGMSITPNIANVTMSRGHTQDIPVTFKNYGGGILTGLTFETATSAGINISVINSGDTNLTSGENQGITVRLTTDPTAPNTGWATLSAKTAEGLSVTLNCNVTIVSLVPIITTSPSYIDIGMVRGNQKISFFTITNTGQEILKNARIEGLSTSWMVLTRDKAIGDLAPGAATSVGFMFSPPDTLAQGVYDDQIVIYSDNHIPYTYHVQVTVTSSAVGSVFFDVLDSLLEHVQNATITFQSQSLPELIYTVKTGADGAASKYDIPEGRYSYSLSPPPGHSPYSGTFTISAGITTQVPIALEVNMVDIQWSVMPVTIEDRYEIQITQTFATNVPTPVLVTEPPVMNLPALQPGQSFNGEFTVTNYGLIAVDNVKINVPSSILDYDVEVFTSAIPSRISAQQKITVPYKVTRRQTIAWNLLDSNDALSALLAEVQGYGGSCTTSDCIKTCGDAIICPNTAQARTVNVCTCHSVGVPTDCPPSGGGGGGGGGGTSAYNGGGGYVPQSGGGTFPALMTNMTVDPGNPCECVKDGDPAKDDVHCCSGGHPISNSMPPSDLGQCPHKVPKAGYAQGTHHNGCGSTYSHFIIPNNPFTAGNFLAACNNHDDNYDRCNKPKAESDTQFCQETVAVCNSNWSADSLVLQECLIFAQSYCYWAANQSAYDDAQKEACSCCR